MRAVVSSRTHDSQKVETHLLKVGPHDDNQVVQALRFLPKELSVLPRLLRVVDGAGSDDNDDLVRVSGEDVCDGGSGGRDGVLGRGREGDLRSEEGGLDEGLDLWMGSFDEQQNVGRAGELNETERDTSGPAPSETSHWRCVSPTRSYTPRQLVVPHLQRSGTPPSRKVVKTILCWPQASCPALAH